CLGESHHQSGTLMPSGAVHPIFASGVKQSMAQQGSACGLLRRGACHRARVRATRWLAKMGWTAPDGISVPDW
ncbi:MAG TPA: hypothetical protein VEU95_02580, partial [Micropepsaceae bacterium]|nr:hypothetical protein [Micropepsaceae bacterium]